MHGCDPGIKLNNHFNVDKLPFMNKKNKTKITAVAGYMNNAGKKTVKLESPFNENINVESVHQHPAIFNPCFQGNKLEPNKNNILKEKKENRIEKNQSFNKKEEKSNTKINGKIYHYFRNLSRN
jgi:hypothetical protein